ncbi:MAG: sensor histidine kinase [Candidatus Competibacterales bacterium]
MNASSPGSVVDATPARAFIQRALLPVGLGIAGVVMAATLASYYQIVEGLKAQTLTQLASHVEQRSALASAPFTLAQDNLHHLATSYREALQTQESVEDFATLFEAHSDGSQRLREPLFQRHSLTGYVPQSSDLEGDLPRRLAVGTAVLAQYGPPWRHQFVNLYLTSPRGVLMYWPHHPWALHADHGQIQAQLALRNSAADTDPSPPLGGAPLAGSPPANTPRWSAPFFDEGVDDWLVSVSYSVLDDGDPLAVGHDVALAPLIQGALDDALAGAYNVLVGSDGRLNAHPRHMEAIKGAKGQLTLDDIDDPPLRALATLASLEETVVLTAPGDSWLAVSPLAGPHWWWVTVYPKAILSATAQGSALPIVWLGGLVMLVVLVILYLALHRRVVAPLGALTAQLKGRERALEDRSARLFEVNAKLNRELEERQRAEAQLARQREIIYQSEKLNALGSLLAGVAHELNNPLSVVVGRAVMLEEALGDTPQGKGIAKLRLAAERCVRIVRTFLAIARQTTPTRQRVAMADIVETALGLANYGLRADGIKVTTYLAAPLPDLWADGDQLVQVLVNLLINAQQAMAHHDGERRIELSAKPLDPEDESTLGPGIVVTVRDTGPGIPPEIQRRIFEPFFTTKAAGKGTGMGLSVCHSMVRSHGGSIRVANHPQGGAQFEILLPVGDAAEGFDGGAAAPAPAVAGRGERILVVDDEV